MNACIQNFGNLFENCELEESDSLTYDLFQNDISSSVCMYGECYVVCSLYAVEFISTKFGMMVRDHCEVFDI
jgi:hypothetical protein